jgi:hypothetical protein
MELDDGHSDGGDQKDDQVLRIWKRRKRKIKPDGNQGKGTGRVLVLVIKTVTPQVFITN